MPTVIHFGSSPTHFKKKHMSLKRLLIFPSGSSCCYRPILNPVFSEEYKNLFSLGGAGLVRAHRISLHSCWFTLVFDPINLAFVHYLPCVLLKPQIVFNTPIESSLFIVTITQVWWVRELRMSVFRTLPLLPHCGGVNGCGRYASGNGVWLWSGDSPERVQSHRPARTHASLHIHEHVCFHGRGYRGFYGNYRHSRICAKNREGLEWG